MIFLGIDRLIRMYLEDQNFFLKIILAIKILKTNISNLKYENKSKILDIDVFKANNNTFNEDEKFQIIFVIHLTKKK